MARPDHDRPLSLRGKEQAIGLLVTLRDQPVTRILTSPTVRCRHTMLPLSHHRGVPIELASSLAVQAPVERLLELVLDPGIRAAVLCGHGEQLRGLLQLLVGRVSLGGPLRLEKGSIWILDPSAGTVGAARYLPPLRPPAPACPASTHLGRGWVDADAQDSARTGQDEAG
jgi:phosphohistidine phosphatase SixA